MLSLQHLTKQPTSHLLLGRLIRCVCVHWGTNARKSIHPTVPAVFRKTRVDVNYNGYLIPGGKTINWNIVHGLRAESIYPEPKK